MQFFGMGSWPMLLSSLRLFFITALTIGNFWSICRIVSHPSKPASRQINRVVVICILFVNLVYLALVWVPFSISSFNYCLKNNDKNNADDFFIEYVDDISFHGGSIGTPEIHPGKVEELFKSIAAATELKEFTASLEEVALANGKDEVALANGKHEGALANGKHEGALANGKHEGSEPKKNSSDEKVLNRVVRRATVESEIHEGSWAVVFPINEGHNEGSKDTEELQDVLDRDIYPSFIDLDCGFQDAVTSSCCYALAFVAIIKLILTTKPLTLPTTYAAQAGYITILTCVPFVATLAIRYAEQIGNKFAPHTPIHNSGGYTVYNIICDIHISDTFVFLSFLEWAGLMMVLLLTVTSFLGVASKTENSRGYSGELNEKVQYRTLEKVVFVGGKWTRDIVLALGAVWSWPMKPIAILAFYVIYGQHWTNCISWTSHLVVAVSVVFIPLSTFLTSYTFLDDEDIWNCNASDEGSESGFPKEVTTKTGVSSLHSNPMRNSTPEVFNPYSNFLSPFDRQFSRGNYLRQFNCDNKNNTTDVDNNGSSIESITELESSKCAEDIRNNLKMRTQEEQPDNIKLVFTLPSNQPNDGDKQLILENEEIGIPNTSDV